MTYAARGIGGSITIRTTGAIAVQKATANGQILVSGVLGAGTILLDAGQSITIAGKLLADNLSQDTEGGIVLLRAGVDITTASTAVISAAGGSNSFGGGLIDCIAQGKIDLGAKLDATGAILAAMGVAQRYNKVLPHHSFGMPHLAKYEMHFPTAPFGHPPDYGVTAPMREDGGERLLSFRLRKRAQNFGVAVVTQSPGSQIDPFVLGAKDENAVQGYVGTPVNINGLMADYQLPVGAAGAQFPLPGTYYVAVDSGRDEFTGRRLLGTWRSLLRDELSYVRRMEQSKPADLLWFRQRSSKDRGCSRCVTPAAAEPTTQRHGGSDRR